MPAKADLRQQLKQARLEMLAAARDAANQAIIKQLKNSTDWSIITTLHYFEPILKLNEVNLTGFIKSLKFEHPKLKIYTSKKLNGLWQIPNIKFDVIIVPMLGFEPNTLHRVGYGGGYYDKFLATQPGAKKIGVCFEQGRVESLPSEPHDISLDIIITDRSVYQN
jgi:5-formyltetrahydrofolate cyclo-ligase